MSEWTPNPTELGQVLAIINALRDPSRQDHKMAVDALNTYVQNESFVLHLVHIFIHGNDAGGIPLDIRQLAGIVTKNYVLQKLSILPVQVQQLLKREFLNGLGDASSEIRSTAGILFGRFAETFPVESWVDMLPPIFQMLNLTTHQQLTLTNGALHAVKRISEDSSHKLAVAPSKPLDQMVPLLIALLPCPDATIRLGSLESLTSMLFLIAAASEEETGEALIARQGSQALLTHMNSFLEVTFNAQIFRE